MSEMPSELKLERRDQANETPCFGGLMIPPKLGEDYWTYRVLLSASQAIVGFPKFHTIGIGFAVEDDWNTNFPYTVEAVETFEHIKCNKGDESIADEDCITAIQMIQAAVTEDRAKEKNNG